MRALHTYSMYRYTGIFVHCTPTVCIGVRRDIHADQTYRMYRFTGIFVHWRPTGCIGVHRDIHAVKTYRMYLQVECSPDLQDVQVQNRNIIQCNLQDVQVHNRNIIQCRPTGCTGINLTLNLNTLQCTD